MKNYPMIKNIFDDEVKKIISEKKIEEERKEGKIESQV